MSRLTDNAPLTESAIRCTVSVEGAKSQDWEMASGGAKTAATTKVRIAQEPTRRVTLPGVSDSADVTVTRHLLSKNEAWAYQSYLLGLVGKGEATVWMTPQAPLDTHATAPDVVSLAYSGLIVSVTPVQSNNEGTGPASFSMTLSGGDWVDA
jgi:hypothetical protein